MEPVSHILGSSEGVQYSNNQYIIAFLKRLSGFNNEVINVILMGTLHLVC